MNKQILYLLSILESVEKVKIYSHDYSDAEVFFEADHQRDFNASLNLLIAIGEDVKKLDEKIKEKAPEVEWSSIVAMRNELSHNYRGIDKDIVWDIIQNYLTPLKEACIYLLLGFQPERKKLEKIVDTVYYKELKYVLSLLPSLPEETLKKE